MMAMLGFVMVCCDGLMFGLCDGWWIFHSSKHSKTDGHAWHYIALHNKTQCDGLMMTHAHAGTRARTRTGGSARTRTPVHARAHEMYVKYLSPTHTKELLWVR